ncbi:MAG: DUF3558 domain-containing protein [Gemmatimonadota bacterium]|nr:DUF3558 domain-containing protein [Gemmatimonadota bacterium]
MHRPTISSALVVSLAIALAACGSKGTDALMQAAKNGDVSRKSDGGTRYVACTLMPKEEVNELTGASYTTAESSDDGRSSGTTCHYTSDTDPAGMSIEINWISPSEYSSEAEHLALQKATIGGAKLAGKLTDGMVAGGINGAPNGPVDGVGDEARFNMMLLTARKGDFTVMVQIVPTNMMAVMTDSTVAIGFVEKEKTVARKLFEKL